MGGKTIQNVGAPLLAPIAAVGGLGNDLGNMVERWNPIPKIKMPEIPGPTKEQLEAQAAQTRLLNQQADQLQAQAVKQQTTDQVTEASARARRARMAGRTSLLLDEVGIIDGTRPVQTTLGA